MRKLLLASVGLYLCGVHLFRSQYQRWGATPAEQELPLPGDELIGAHHDTRAVTIEAPVAAVWPWLAQLGQDRGGLYSYSWLENLFLADIHNADRIHPEWQDLQVGGFVRLASRKVYGDLARLRVLAVEPGSHLVLAGWGSLVLVGLEGGRTRLYVRTMRPPAGLIGDLARRYLFEPPHFVMERGMMLGIKKRAEALHRPQIQAERA
jgi:hypothetical protein